MYAGHELAAADGHVAGDGGGPLNLVVAFALCIIIELPFAFAYMEAIPMLPLPRRRGGVLLRRFRQPGGASPWGGRAS